MRGVLLVGALVALGGVTSWSAQTQERVALHRLLVLVDMSGSMSTAGGSLVSSSAGGAHLRWVRQLEDELIGAVLEDRSVEVMVGTFSNKIAFGEQWRTSSADVVQDLRGLVQLGGRSPIVDAIALAIDRLSGSTGRKAIVVVTDGFNAGNQLRASDVVERASSTGVRIHTMMRTLGTRGSSATERARRWFAEISEKTGGEQFECEAMRLETVCSPGGNLKDALGRVALSLSRGERDAEVAEQRHQAQLK